jgi:hypothetical protein
VLAVVAAVVGTVLLVTDARRDREARDRAAQRRAVAAEVARLRRIQAPHRGAATRLRPPPAAGVQQRLAARRALVDAVERRITRDARARAAAGELDGPIATTECGPLLRARDAVPDDRRLDRPIGRYDCLAAKAGAQPDESVGSFGYPFVAALDFRRFTYAWCRNTPAQGEAGRALAHVRLDRACLAARGRALGTGYVDVQPR